MKRINELRTEIERLTADRDKWEYEARLAYEAFNESNVKKMYADTHKSDIQEHNRMLHEIAVLKALLTRAAYAIEECVYVHRGGNMNSSIANLIVELRKAAE